MGVRINRIIKGILNKKNYKLVEESSNKDGLAVEEDNHEQSNEKLNRDNHINNSNKVLASNIDVDILTTSFLLYMSMIP